MAFVGLREWNDQPMTTEQAKTVAFGMLAVFAGIASIETVYQVIQFLGVIK
jgi:hypothetical protein